MERDVKNVRIFKCELTSIWFFRHQSVLYMIFLMEKATIFFKTKYFIDLSLKCNRTNYFHVQNLNKRMKNNYERLK